MKSMISKASTEDSLKESVRSCAQETKKGEKGEYKVFYLSHDDLVKSLTQFFVPLGT